MTPTTADIFAALVTAALAVPVAAVSLATWLVVCW